MPGRASLQAAVLAMAALGLAACAPAMPPMATPSDRLAPLPEAADLPPARAFGAPDPLPPQRSNTEIARDFLDLSFALESGTPLPVLTRFEAPVTIALAGRTAGAFDRELDRLIDRLRREARIDIARIADSARADIVIEAVPQHEMQRLVPQAACFVLPRRLSWAEFRADPRRRDLNWTDLVRREEATVFIPADVSLQEIRDCLHEEVAQALGPLNDLYRLEDSIFNDDNMHSVLTGFDMLVLRVTYDDALASGMTRDEVAARLPAILAEVNPRGAGFATRPYQPSPRHWIDATERALSGARRTAARRAAADEALRIAREEGWQDGRLGLSLLTKARLSDPSDSRGALSAFLGAAQVYGEREATAIHAANVGVQIAAFGLAAGDADAALRIADRYVPVARRAENAALLSDLLMIRAAALTALGRPGEASTSQREALAWGRYGQRGTRDLRARAAEIAALYPGPGGPT